MDQFSEDDPDVAAFRAATKRARKSGMVGFARVVVAGAVAAAVGLAGHSAVDVFAEVRQRKDTFRG